jgi:hypothetical protein
MNEDSYGRFRDERDCRYLMRSDGGGFFVAAWALLAVAVMCILMSFAMKTTNFMGEAYIGHIQAKANFLMIGLGFIFLWANMLIAAFLIRAIYFVNGDGMKPCAETMTVGERVRLRAEWEAMQPLSDE